MTKSVGGGSMSDDPLDQLERRIPTGCRLDLYAGFGPRLCVEPYDEVMARVRDADPQGQIEVKVLAGSGPKKAEIVRLSIDVAVVGAVMEVTAELEDRWKEVEQEQEEARAQAGQGFMIQMPGGGGFRLG
jgi:hypothetical protein